MKRQIKETSRFFALGSDGKKYQVIEFTEFLEVTTIHDAQTRWEPGMKILKLENGEHVNPVDGGGFEIPRTGVHLSVANKNP